jgi:hypothetical protein
MSPAALRVFSGMMSSTFERNGASACTTTRYVRPKRLKRAEINLQRLEHVGKPHVLALHLDAVHVDIELRHVDLVAREHTGERRLAVGAVEHVLQRLVQCLSPLVGAIFHLQFEPAERAEPENGRRRVHRDERALHRLQLRGERARDGGACQVFRLALFERRERKEHDRGARAVHVAVHRKAGELHGVSNARLGQADIRHLPDHCIRSIDRRGRRQLRHGDNELFVLRGNESAGYCLEAEICEADEPRIHEQCDGATANRPSRRPHVAVARGRECIVEPTEESAEHALHDARQRVVFRGVGLQQCRGQRRRQRERVECGDQG